MVLVSVLFENKKTHSLRFDHWPTFVHHKYSLTYLCKALTLDDLQRTWFLFQNDRPISPDLGLSLKP